MTTQTKTRRETIAGEETLDPRAVREVLERMEEEILGDGGCGRPPAELMAGLCDDDPDDPEGDGGFGALGPFVGSGWRVVSVRRIAGDDGSEIHPASCWRGVEEHRAVARARALLWTGEAKAALEVLVPLHRRRPCDREIQALLCGALRGLGKTENDFPWTERPVLVGIDRRLLDHLADALCERGTHGTVLDLHRLASELGVTTFGPDDLHDALAGDGRFALQWAGISCASSMVSKAEEQP